MALPAFSVSSGAVSGQFSLPYITAGRCASINSAGQVVGVPCGSGSANIAVTTGNISGFNSIVSSPTAVINFDSSTFNLSLQGGATVYILPNPSSVTLQGNNLSSTYLTNSSATVTYLQVSSAAATYLTQSSASVTYFPNAGILTVAHGGTGVSNPGLIAGTNITSITGTWPNQTINATTQGGGASILNTNVLQSGATFFVSSGSVAGQFSPKTIKWPDGTVQVSSPSSGAIPGGSNTQVQYNSSGSFAGTPNLLVNPSSISVTLEGVNNAVVASTYDTVGLAVISTVTCQGVGSNPDSVTGLMAWYKADALTYGDGVNVSTWTDSSSNGFDLILQSGSSFPVFHTNVLNGKPTVTFTSISGLKNTSFSSFDNNANSVIMVVNNTSNSSDIEFLRAGRLELFYSHDNLETRHLFVDSLDGGATSTFATKIFNGFFNINSFTSANPGGTNFYVDGVADSSNPLSVGASSGGLLVLGNASYTGKIAELIIYNKALSASERVGVETYLSNKYNIAISSVSGSCTKIPQINHIQDWRNNDNIPISFVDSAGNITVTTATPNMPVRTDGSDKFISGQIVPSDVSTGTYHIVADTMYSSTGTYTAAQVIKSGTLSTLQALTTLPGELFYATDAVNTKICTSTGTIHSLVDVSSQTVSCN